MQDTVSLCIPVCDLFFLPYICSTSFWIERWSITRSIIIAASSPLPGHYSEERPHTSLVQDQLYRSPFKYYGETQNLYPGLPFSEE